MNQKTKLLPALLGALLCASAAVTAASADEAETGWQTVNGRRYYYTEDGTPATGEYTVDGVTYLFAPNGAQQTGWQTVGGVRRYFTAEGEALTGRITWRGEEYYIDPELGKLTGPAQTADGMQQFDAFGVLETGWIRTESGWRYAGESGVLVFGETMIGGLPYLFTDAGDLLTGWQTASDGITRWYDPESAQITSGWITQPDGSRSYADPETGRVTGVLEAADGTYLFDENGIMQTGFVTCGDGITRYYSETDGRMATGLTLIGGKRYCFCEDGTPFAGLMQCEDGVRRAFAADGAVLAGWYHNMGTSYYFDENGDPVSGITVIGEDAFFLNEAGIMQRGLISTAAGTVYANGSGLLQRGWVTLGSSKYCFGEDYLGCTGEQDIDGLHYYFTDTGLLRTGLIETADGIRLLNTDGQPADGWITLAGSTYYCAEPGIPLTGWQELEGHGFWFSEAGVMAVSTTVEGFTIDENGYARCANAVTADNLLQSAGNTLSSIFSYSVSRHRYSRIEATRTYAQLSAAGWDTLVTYTLANKRGVCYYLAAVLDYFYQRKGYTTRLVHATHSTGNHYWVQVLVNGAWQNYDPTYSSRCNISWANIIAAGNYTVLGYVTIHYDARGAYLGDEYTSYS